MQYFDSSDVARAMVDQSHMTALANSEPVVPAHMKKYVCGFLIDREWNHVLLIEKNKPAWQAEKLNGVGGKIELGETPYQAMVREFKEETGLTIEHWRCYAILTHDNGVVYMFTAEVDAVGTYAYTPKQLTDEHPYWVNLEVLPYLKRINNLDWLVPMAMSDSNEVAIVNDPTSIPKEAS